MPSIALPNFQGQEEANETNKRRNWFRLFMTMPLSQTHMIYCGNPTFEAAARDGVG